MVCSNPFWKQEYENLKYVMLTSFTEVAIHSDQVRLLPDTHRQFSFWYLILNLDYYFSVSVGTKASAKTLQFTAKYCSESSFIRMVTLSTACHKTEVNSIH